MHSLLDTAVKPRYDNLNGAKPFKGYKIPAGPTHRVKPRYDNLNGPKPFIHYEIPVGATYRNDKA